LEEPVPARLFDKYQPIEKRWFSTGLWRVPKRMLSRLLKIEWC
jgi:hypothetical protein